jgi:hypothetical protein
MYTLPELAFEPANRVLLKRADGAWDPGVLLAAIVNVTPDGVGVRYRVELERAGEKRRIVKLVDEHQIMLHPEQGSNGSMAEEVFAVLDQG